MVRECGCDEAAVHVWWCPLTPVWRSLIWDGFGIGFWPGVFVQGKFSETWMCAVHGLMGDVNGPVHYETCPRTLP